MPDVSTLGLIAAALTTTAFVPQVIQVIRTKDTSAISLSMYILFVLGLALWLYYGILINDMPIIVANTITISLSSIILILKIRNTIKDRRVG